MTRIKANSQHQYFIEIERQYIKVTSRRIAKEQPKELLPKAEKQLIAPLARFAEVRQRGNHSLKPNYY
ncbi:hypothetical protein [Hymenobacter terrigena]